MGQVGQSDENPEQQLPTALAAPKLAIVYREDYIVNDRGVQLFTCQWLPAGQQPRALVFLCHGYGMECSVFMKDTGERLARAGFAVFGIDYEGHGKSEGRRCYISKFSNIISDVATHFISVQDRKENKGKGSFLYGESMGGAVALLLNRKEPSRWKGMVLVAPMAKIAEKMRPSPFMIAALSKLNGLVPGWKVVPVGDVFELAFKNPEKRKQIRSNKLLYHDKPRIRTAHEMYQTSLDLEEQLDEAGMQEKDESSLPNVKFLPMYAFMDGQVASPFLLVHGEDDTVTDPEVSKALFDQSRSLDKTMKLYKGLWHGLTSGEEDQDIDMVFNDIIQWLNDRSGTGSASSSGNSPVRHADLTIAAKASDHWEDNMIQVYNP